MARSADRRRLAFAVRRLARGADRDLLARGSERRHQIPLGLDRALAPEQIHTITLGPLSLGALHVVLRDRFGRSLPRPAPPARPRRLGRQPLLRARDRGCARERRRVASGNRPAGPARPRGTAPRQARLARRPMRDRALLVVAASSQPTLELDGGGDRTGPRRERRPCSGRASGCDPDATGQLRFTHPFSRRRCTPAPPPTPADPRIERSPSRRPILRSELGIWLLLGGTRPIRSPTPSTMRRAWPGLGGRPIPPRSLPTWPRQLTPPTDTESIVRRGVEAASYHFNAGNVVRARELFLRTAAASPPGPARAQIMLRLADATWSEIDLVRSYLDEALRDAGGDPAVECGIRWDLAWTWVYGGDLDEGRRQADGPWRSRSDSRTTSLSRRRSRRSAICEFLAGRDGEDRIARALALRETGSSSPTPTRRLVVTGPAVAVGRGARRSRITLEPVLDHLAEPGLYTLATETDRVSSARSNAAPAGTNSQPACRERDRDQARSGVRGSRGTHLFPQALVDALRGGVESARLARERGSHGPSTRRPLLRELQSRGARVRGASRRAGSPRRASTSDP